MERASKRSNIISQFIEWYLIDQPKAIFIGWKNLLLFNLNYFSIPLLLKTLFSPWRRYAVSYGRGVDFKRYIEAFSSNAISRGIGAFIRSFLIILGAITEIILFLLGIVVLILWFLFPLIIFFIFALGFKAIF